MSNIVQTRAMLATLSISAWTARKQDKSVSAEVEKAHGAHDAGKYNKLLVDKSLLDPISRLAARVRESHYFSTHAWNDSGARLLPTKLFMSYTDQMRKYRAEFDKLVNELLAKYPAEVQAARVRLGSMYNPGDYPDVANLANRFAINIEYTPVPAGDDFRIDLGEAAAAELRASVTAGVAKRQADALKATYGRVREVVSKIEERLSIPDAIFKDTLISNAQDLCVVLEGLNINDDPTLTEIAWNVAERLDYPPTLLRTSPSARRSAVESARDILAMIPGG